jgi:hypothetical protein
MRLFEPLKVGWAHGPTTARSATKHGAHNGALRALVGPWAQPTSNGPVNFSLK